MSPAAREGNPEPASRIRKDSPAPPRAFAQVSATVEAGLSEKPVGARRLALAEISLRPIWL